MLERGSRSLHHVQHEVNSNKSEKISHQPGKTHYISNASPQITANHLLKAVLWFHGVRHAQIPHPKHLAAQCQQLVPAEVLFQRVTVSLSGVKVCCWKIMEKLCVGCSSCQVHPKVVETALGAFQSAMVYEVYQFQIVSWTDSDCRSVDAKSVF